VDCIQAQAIISEAIDRSPVDAAVLEMAKEHCRTCPSCAVYVRALNEVKSAPLPAPPADLADRIVAAVRAEAEANVHAESEPTPEGETRATEIEAVELESAPQWQSVPDASVPAVAELRPHVAPLVTEIPVAEIASRVSVGSSPLDRRRTYAWLGAAAVVLVAVGVLGALGVMKLVGTGSRTAVQTSQMAATAPAEPQASAGGAAPQTESTTERAGVAAVPSTVATAPAGEYVVLAGIAYLHSGPADLTVAQVPNVGTMRLAFSSGKTPTMRTVYAKDAKQRIYIQDDSQVLQSFDVVTRTYQGVTYSLRARDIDTLGTWPQMPVDIQTPTSPNGSPVFALDSESTSSAPVYHRTGSSAKQGIAIPPNTPPPDPAAGNPSWTWWMPL
jgi:hypothetical protein